MAGRELSFFEEILDGGFKFQQAQRVRNRGAILAGSIGHLFLGEAEFVRKPLKCAGLLDGVQVFALEIFNQRHFKRHLFRNVSDDDGNAAQARPLSRAPAALSSYELIARACPSSDEWLHNAAYANGTRQLLESLFAEARPRLVRAGID